MMVLITFILIRDEVSAAFVISPNKKVPDPLTLMNGFTLFEYNLSCCDDDSFLLRLTAFNTCPR